MAGLPEGTKAEVKKAVRKARLLKGTGDSEKAFELSDRVIDGLGKLLLLDLNAETVEKIGGGLAEQFKVFAAAFVPRERTVLAKVPRA